MIDRHPGIASAEDVGKSLGPAQEGFRIEEGAAEEVLLHEIELGAKGQAPGDVGETGEEAAEGAREMLPGKRLQLDLLPGEAPDPGKGQREAEAAADGPG